MPIIGLGQNTYQNKFAIVQNMNGAKKPAVEKTGTAQDLTEAEEMELFKKEFYAEIDRIPRDRTIANVAVQISEEAFKNMKADPEYREQMLSLIRRDMTGSVAPAPDCSMIIRVGATAKDYRADSWSVYNDSEFYARSQDSFYKKTSNKKDRQKELLAEFLKKRTQVKRRRRELMKEKAAKAQQERSRLAAASHAYEANIMTEVRFPVG
ncbi:MAG: hypothetical protein HFH29_09640 [Eubacterium sp.]|nr:hypothetical protein [Eubacterium sp.]